MENGNKIDLFFLPRHTLIICRFLFSKKLENVRPLRTTVIISSVGAPGRSGRDRYMKVTGLLRFDIVVNPIVWVTQS